MTPLCLLPLLLLSAAADKTPSASPAPVYGVPAATQTATAQKREDVVAAADSYGSPAAPAAPAPTPDTYGAPKAPVVDSYGSPAAPPVKTESYGAPAAAPVEQPAPIGNQGYYYYYYPVKPNQPPKEAEAAGGGGLLGGIDKRLLVVLLGIGAALLLGTFLLTAFAGKRSFSRSLDSMYEFASPFATEENLVSLADFVNKAIRKHQ